MIRILIVDDSEDDAQLLARRVVKAGYGLHWRRVDNGPAMTKALAEDEWDAVISDVNMPGFSVEGALAVARASGTDLPFIVVSGIVGEEMAVALLKSGAHDFVLKSNLARLVPALEREMREAKGRAARRRAEEALRASQERYALAAKGSHDGLWDWDLRSDRIYFSSRWKEMLGLEPDEVGDDPCEWLFRIHPDDLALVGRRLTLHLSGQNDRFACEHRLRHRDGSWRWMLTRAAAIRNGEGKPVRMAGSFTDVTATKQAAEELEAALAAKTRFLAAASHDMRQPAQALFCFVGVLEHQLRDHPAARTLDDVQNALKAMREILDSLLDVSKLDAGMVMARLANVHLGDFLDDLVSEMGVIAEAKGLRLHVEPSSLVGRSDPALLGRVMRNLLDNAIRYTHEGRVTVGCRRRQGRVWVEVWDTGEGIAAAVQDRIFEEFYQVGNAERDRRKGLGLGLSIVQRLCRLLGHEVRVRSVEGKGSCFSVALPLAETPVRVEVQEEGEAAKPSSLPPPLLRYAPPSQLRLREALSNR